MLVILTVWFALPDTRSRIIGAVLCITSRPLFESSVVLLPDIIVTAFMALSSLLLFNRKGLIQRRGTCMLAPLAAVAFLFFAFLAKESAYWVLPLWAVALFSDIKGEDRRILFRRFYPPVFVGGVSLIVMYLVFCRLHWGVALVRFKSVQALTGQHLWSWDKAPVMELVKRLTTSPVNLLLGQYGAILLLAVLGFVVAPRSIRPWGYYSIFCLLFFWFGSTSFTRYEPMPLVGRMTLPLLPGLYILAAFMASRLSVRSERSGLINSFIPMLLVLVLAGVPFANYVKSWKWQERSEANAVGIVQKELKAHPARKVLLVCSDSRSPVSLSFYFGYRYPANLRVTSVEALTDASLRSAEKCFVFVDRKRSAFLKSAYGSPHYDDAIYSLRLKPVYKSGYVVLFASESKDALRKLILPDNRN